MELLGIERMRYFAPTAICGYLAGLCAVLTVTSAFLHAMPDALAVTAAALFGLVMSGSLGLLFWQAQRRDLRFERLTTPTDASANFDAVRAAALAAGWRVLGEERGRRLEAQTADTRFATGERVSIRFRARDVLVASICDPAVGFSLVGRRRCSEHREFVRRTVQGA
jgi:hypothetical protein